MSKPTAKDYAKQYWKAARDSVVDTASVLSQWTKTEWISNRLNKQTNGKIWRSKEESKKSLDNVKKWFKMMWDWAKKAVKKVASAGAAVWKWASAWASRAVSAARKALRK